SLGYRVVRVWNNEVLGIWKACCKCSRHSLNLPLTLSLSPQAGRGNAAAMPDKNPDSFSRRSQESEWELAWVMKRVAGGGGGAARSYKSGWPAKVDGRKRCGTDSIGSAAGRRRRPR